MTTTSHYHRCKECRERMFDACIDPTCSIGVRWVVLCIECYELRSRVEAALY